MDHNLSRVELEETLRGLTRLLNQGVAAYEAKRAEVGRLVDELHAIADTNKSLQNSIAAVQRALGLPTQQTDKPVPPASVGASGEIDTTLEVMKIVAEHHDKGGIDIDAISDKLMDRGITLSSRDYLHTILNRKKNKQKKLVKVEGKWFLTDKGRAEVRMRTE